MTGVRLACGVQVRRFLFLVLAGLALAACEQVPLYNKEKDELAKSAQTTYLDAKITEAYTIQENNLRKLLQAEVDALNESAALRLDIALLRMSDNRAVPDGSTSLAGWYVRAHKAEADLGFPGSALVLAMLDHRVEVTKAEAVILRLKNRFKTDDAIALRTLPGCDEIKAMDPVIPAWSYLDTIEDEVDREIRRDEYGDYVRECKTATQPLPGAGGRVAEAFNELMQTEAELAVRRVEAAALSAAVAEAADRVKAAQQQGEAAQQAVADATAAVEKHLDQAKQAADSLLDAVEALREAAGGEGEEAIAERNIEAISVILGAVGSGQANAEGLEDNRVADAAAWIRKNVPSLAADMAALIDRSRAPPVSNLILELQHQTIELGYARALIRLSELRVELLRARYTRLVDQAGAWRGFRLSLCNYAMLSAGRSHPGAACDGFEALPVNQNEAACSLDGVALDDCALKQTWREVLTGQADNRVERELWSALYYFAEAVEAERATRESEFRLVDIEHREVLAAQRAGIEAWGNLVEVPVGQLAAYHASGIQPEALAEAIAIVLGLTAVGAGAAQ